jgi:CheY-like chemotaxis protein
LGLAISNRLAELMEGRIWVESRLHEGSTFFFEVPLTFEVPLAAAETPATGVAKEPVASPALPSGLRVLVAEDNPINQKVIARIAALAGSLVDIAENGEVAVERHQSSPYDLILMDCQMPVLDGYEATARIRALPGAASRVPIIGVTANAFAEDRDRCLRVGMDHYLAKPLSREALLAAMSRFAGVREVIAD